MNTTGLPELEEEGQCAAHGLIMRKGNEVKVAMVWHMAHSLSEEYQKDFLKLRCKALQAVFGNINKAQGLRTGELASEGIILSLSSKVVDRPKPCLATMGFTWPNVNDTRWSDIKQQFKDVFEPAALHGGVSCREVDEMIIISSHFEVAEKGGD